MSICNRRSFILFCFFQLLLAFQIFPVNSQILNNIIRLGDHPYRYVHFSYNSEGDLIIDTEAYPSRKDRKFYGIKKNGKEYFSDNEGNKNYKYKLTLQYDNGRSSSS